MATRRVPSPHKARVPAWLDTSGRTPHLMLSGIEIFSIIFNEADEFPSYAKEK